MLRLKIKLVMVILLASIFIGHIAFCENGDVVKVKGQGSGTTEELALKDAYRDAVESAVGMYVDAEQAAKNDELIKDQILTQSNAYIEDYDVIEKKKENDLFMIKILARVKRQEITKRLSGAMKAKHFKVGGGLKNLHAQMTTTEKKSCDGAALLAQALEGIDPIRQLMEVSIASDKAVQIAAKDRQKTKKRRREVDDQQGIVELAYLFKFEINRGRYFKEFLPNLERVLTQVSDREPREIVITASTDANTKENMTNKLYMDAGDSGYITMNRKIERDYGALVGRKSFSSTAFGITDGSPALESVLYRDKPLDVVVVTEANETMTAIRGKLFSLDPASGNVVNDFHNGKLAVAAGAHKIAYNVLFLDEQGKMVSAHQIKLENLAYNVKLTFPCESVVDVRQTEMRNNRFWFVTPFIGCKGAAYYKWCSFKIAKDDLPKIDSIKIELAK